MTVQITPSEFRKLENRFVFQGGSEFGNSIADALERLTAERDAAIEGAAQEARYNTALRDQMPADRKQYLDMRDERDALRAELEELK